MNLGWAGKKPKKLEGKTDKYYPPNTRDVQLELPAKTAFPPKLTPVPKPRTVIWNTRLLGSQTVTRLLVGQIREILRGWGRKKRTSHFPLG